MLLGSRKAFAAIAAAAVLVGGAGAGAAVAGKGHREGLLLKAAVQYIGVGKAEVVKDARAGKTLAQIATAHGKTVDGLKAAMLAAVKAKLDTAVVAGKATTLRSRPSSSGLRSSSTGSSTRRSGKSRDGLEIEAAECGRALHRRHAESSRSRSEGREVAGPGRDGSRKDSRRAEGGPRQAVQGPPGQGRRGEAHHCRPGGGKLAKVSARLDKLISRTN